MRAMVGFVGVLQRAGPRRSKRERDLSSSRRLNMCGPLGFTGTRQHFGFGDKWRYSTKNCGRRFDRKAMMHGSCILIYPGPREICYSTQN